MHEAAKVLEEMGHEIVPARPEADTDGMMHAWTIIVGCGAALGVRKTVEARGYHCRTAKSRA